MSSVRTIRLNRFDRSLWSERDDLIVVEEPLEIRLGFGKGSDRVQERLVVTMRTPGNDFELAIGVLFSENIIDSFDQIAGIHYCETVKPEEKDNVIRVELSEEVPVDLNSIQRNFYSNSACGVCGKTSIDAVLQQCDHIDSNLRVGRDIILGLPGKLTGDQLIFKHTGGIHAVAAFNQEGELIEIREDVGRHNAMDKLVGHFLQKGDIDFSNRILLLSGRISYELVQKASNLGVPIICAVGAPSSLAIDLAQSVGITLIGFLKDEYFNVYTGNGVEMDS